MKYGVQLHPLGQFPSIESIIETTKLIEDLGFDYVAFPEHTLFPVALEGMLTRDWFDPLTLISYLVGHTQRLHFYTACTVITQHNPIHLAKQATTIDVISNGRLGLCVAGGWLEQEISWLGGNPRTRGKTVEEYIQLMRALWLEDPVSFSGANYRFENASFHPKPVNKTVPLFVGGGAHVSAARAARLGDGWMPANSFEELKTGIKVLDSELKAQGRSRDNFPVFAELPLFDQPAGVQKYLREIGAQLPESFAGDYQQAKVRDAALRNMGVTHASIFPSLPSIDQLHQALKQFAREFLSDK